MSTNSFILQSQKIEEYRSLTKPFTKELAGLMVEVHPNVYPGSTDSELLAESIEITPGDVALDLCTGNGIVAIYMHTKGAAKVTGADLNPAAVANALRNKELHDADDVRFIKCDMFPPGNQLYDVITINPPYTDSQSPDETAICFWDKDNRVVKSLFRELRQYLKPSGTAYITWSSFADQELLPHLAAKNNIRIELIKSRGGKSGFTYYVYRLSPTTGM
jgi:release factor glutamine methyltransferase